MELVLLIVSFSCMIWGIYNYSELQKLEFKAEKTFMEMAKELEILKKEIWRSSSFYVTMVVNIYME